MVLQHRDKHLEMI